jgi:hypothetical protein
LRGDLPFGLFILPSHVCGQAVVVRRFGLRAELGELRGYLQFGFFVLASDLCGQAVIVTHGMFPSPWPPLLAGPARQTQ